MTEYDDGGGRVVVDMREFNAKCESTDGRKLSAKVVRQYLNECSCSCEGEGQKAKSGKWEPVPSTIFKCTACGGQFDFDDGSVSPFCPMCGARMDMVPDDRR